MSLIYRDLHALFFQTYPQNATKFIALSGYVGIEPIRSLKKLPFESKIIYGMFNESPKPQLHAQMRALHDKKTTIYYPNFLCHAKCYLWMEKEKPIKGLIGSANFSSNGLQNDYRETLFQVDLRELYSIKAFIELIIDNSIICVDYGLPKPVIPPLNPDICDLALYDLKTGQTQKYAALNWGMSPKSHVSKDDAYIPILRKNIEEYPALFPSKLPKIEGRKRQNEIIEIIWDDGNVMEGLLEGTQTINGIVYPKQISSHPRKNILGIYLRKRIGVKSGQRILREDLVRYGRDIISVSLLSEGVYYFDFKS